MSCDLYLKTISSHLSKRKRNSVIHIWNLPFLFFCYLKAPHSLCPLPVHHFWGRVPTVLCIFRLSLWFVKIFSIWLATLVLKLRGQNSLFKNKSFFEVRDLKNLQHASQSIWVYTPELVELRKEKSETSTSWDGLKSSAPYHISTRSLSWPFLKKDFTTFPTL